MNDQAALNDALLALTQIPKSAPEASTGTWTPEMVQFLTMSTFAFMALALLLCTLLLWRKDASSAHVLRVFGIITILGLSALLLFVGYSNEQLTPIVGLFGAIAGYLLGKDSALPTKPAEPTPP
jgi:hypothetical protein